MPRTWKRWLLAIGGLLALAGGCGDREHRSVRVHEETREGQVVEEQPGEMVVE